MRTEKRDRTESPGQLPQVVAQGRLCNTLHYRDVAAAGHTYVITPDLVHPSVERCELIWNTSDCFRGAEEHRKSHLFPGPDSHSIRNGHADRQP